MTRIEATQLHSREINLHLNGRSRTVRLMGQTRGDFAAQTRAVAELVTAGLVERPESYTGRHPGDWPS